MKIELVKAKRDTQEALVSYTAGVVIVLKRKRGRRVWYEFDLAKYRLTEAAQHELQGLWLEAWQQHARPGYAARAAESYRSEEYFACYIPEKAEASFEPAFLKVAADDASYRLRRWE